jgi:hypothetical protein
MSALLNLVRRVDMRVRAVLVTLGVIFLGLAWYLGSPLFIDYTVDESFPVAPSVPASQPSAVGIQPAAVAITVDAVPTPPPETIGQPKASVTPNPPGAAPTPAVVTAAFTATVAPVSEPVSLATGQFNELDSVHKGEGTATIFSLPDGERVLRFENFRVTNGPDLFVYLSGHPAPKSSSELHQAGHDIDLGRLKGNVGNQNYVLPANVDLTTVKSVAIYCKRFTTMFSTAELRFAN